MKEYQVVLSIFKGTNFVVKRSGGIQCKIIGKVNESILESRIFNLNTTCSEPDFNYQIAWKLNKKKFQELRLNRGNVKIECHQLTNDAKIESLIGYCLISIKEAIEITSYEEIDVKNSKCLPLTGTKQPWLQYGPKLYCMLHFEDPDKVIAPTQKRKMILKNPSKKDQAMKAPLPPPPSATLAPLPKTFCWSTNNEMGYFQLGQPGSSDDLYIMNITLIYVRHVRQLLVPKSSQSSYMKWRIMYDAFGITITSDDFTILDDDCDCKQTYLGDKSTARIRANEQEFSAFLNDSVLEMKIVTVKDEKLELQGKAFIELETLTNPETIEIRSVVDIIPNQAKNIPGQHKPQLIQVIDLKKSPNFFAKNYIKIEDICFPGANLTSSKENLAQLEKELSSMSVGDIIKDDGARATDFSEVGAGDKSAKMENLNEEEVVVPEEQSYKDPLNKYSFSQKISDTKSPAETVQEPHVPVSGRSQESSSTSTSKSRAVSIQEKDVLPSPIKNVPRKSKVLPGNYVLNLKFYGLDIKCRRAFTSDWFVIFHHPPLSVGPEDKCILHAKPKEFLEEKRLMIFDFDDDETESWVLAIPKITQEILESPLKVFFHGSDKYLDEDPISFAHIPLGDIFSVDSIDNRRQIKGSAPVYTFKRSGKNCVRIGFCGYEFLLSEAKIRNDLESSASMFSVTTVHQETPKEKDCNSNYASRKENSIEDWRLQEEKKFIESLKEKEKAYFQILSAEHKKQKEESEKTINQRLLEMENRKLELEKKMRLLSEKEERLQIRETQLNESTRTNQFQLHQELEELKLQMRSLEAEKNTEIKSLQRQLDDATNILKISNEKYRCLEIKINAKDDEIAKLMSNRNKWPDLEALVKIEKLEQEIEQHKKSLKKALEERDTYRLQNQKVIKALQQQSEDSREQLRTENENLKLQMFAAREHELLNKERKQVEDISHEIRRLQRSGQVYSSKQRHSSVDHRVNRRSPLTSETPSDHFQSSSSHLPRKSQSNRERDALLEKEIERLTRSREGLLKTQAYTKYDTLIREIEQEILKNIQLRAELQQSD